MKKLFLFILCISHLQFIAQNIDETNGYIDREQRRLDSLDGIVDGKIELKKMMSKTSSISRFISD